MDIDGNNTLSIKAIEVIISTFETLPNIQTAVFNAIKAIDPKTKDRGAKEQKLGVLNDISLGNTSGGNCRACLVEIEFIDVEEVDKLLNLNPDAPAVRSQIADAIAQAIIHDLEHP